MSEVMTTQDAAALTTLARAAAGLHANGQRTEASQRSVARLAAALGVATTVDFSWRGVLLNLDHDRSRHVWATARPAVVDMRQVVTTSKAVAAFVSGAIECDELERKLSLAQHRITWPTAAFACAAIGGACALAVIFGARDAVSLLLVAVAAGLGAVLRRGAARLAVAGVGQATLAALVAGLVGGLAVRHGLGRSPELVALCSCMILVPGPHIINGGLDSIAARMDLAVSRLAYAAVLLTGISAGLIAGMAVCGVTFPATGPASTTAFWPEVLAAGLTGYAYSTFFNTPGPMIIWPVAVGALAHAVRWTVLHVGGNTVTATALACLAAGAALTPVAHHRHLPFAPVAFASVVSMIPGAYVFRALSGLSQLATTQTHRASLAVDVAQDGATALALTLAVVLGVAVPASIGDRLIYAPRSTNDG